MSNSRESRGLFWYRIQGDDVHDIPGPRFLAGEAALHRFPVRIKGQVSIKIIHMEKISGSRIFGGKKNIFKPEQDGPLEVAFAVPVGFCSAGEEIRNPGTVHKFIQKTP